MTQRARKRDACPQVFPGANALRAVRAGRSVRNLCRATVLPKRSPPAKLRRNEGLPRPRPGLLPTWAGSRFLITESRGSNRRQNA
jgi:hypothetical protein